MASRGIQLQKGGGSPVKKGDPDVAGKGSRDLTLGKKEEEGKLGSQKIVTLDIIVTDDCYLVGVPIDISGSDIKAKLD